VRPGYEQVGQPGHADEREHDRSCPELVGGRPWGARDVRGQAMLTVSKASHATASALMGRPARLSRNPPAGTQVPRSRATSAAIATSRNAT
jgi:hypothetical protein